MYILGIVSSTSLSLAWADMQEEEKENETTIYYNEENAVQEPPKVDVAQTILLFDDEWNWKELRFNRVLDNSKLFENEEELKRVFKSNPQDYLHGFRVADKMLMLRRVGRLRLKEAPKSYLDKLAQVVPSEIWSPIQSWYDAKKKNIEKRKQDRRHQAVQKLVSNQSSKNATQFNGSNAFDLFADEESE